MRQIRLLPSGQFHFLLLLVFVFLEYVSSIVVHCGRNVYADINVLVDIKPEVRLGLLSSFMYIAMFENHLVGSPQATSVNENPAFVVNNDDLPDYETISKESNRKDPTPPPYNFVTTHPNDFGITARVPSAPPVYSSRRNSSATVNSEDPTH